ncbi:ubiquitin carboxyl-terminal hydrolase 26-like [Engraulis encrasicolus]|uniref:ubiquitin carboxyl-terminal hydrolase 26-like n=1 Tax=Engraulis encrasicolus TaxID=184585 RepID=UPI002FD2DAC8
MFCCCLPRKKKKQLETQTPSKRKTWRWARKIWRKSSAKVDPVPAASQSDLSQVAREEEEKEGVSLVDKEQDLASTESGSCSDASLVPPEEEEKEGVSLVDKEQDATSEEAGSCSDAPLVIAPEEEEKEVISLVDKEQSVLDGTALVDVGLSALVDVGVIIDVYRSLLSMGVTALVDVGVTAVAPASFLLPQQLQCRGLPNMGNTCYINATLQCLLSGQSFCTQLRRQEETVREGPSALLISSLVGVLGLRTSSDRELKRAVLMELKHLVSLRNRRFEGNSQNDAHEFLHECLLGLRVRGRDLGDVATQCPVDTVLSFQLLQIRSCRSCGLESRGEDNVTYISLPMVAQGSVRSCLEHYFTASPVEFRCECGGQESDMRMQLHTLPKVLILQLVRFCPFTLNKTEDALLLDTELQVMPR